MATRVLVLLAVLAIAAGCGGSTATTSSAPAKITRDAHGQAFVRVDSEAEADRQCEALQENWPASVKQDEIHFIRRGSSPRESLVGCVRP